MAERTLAQTIAYVFGREYIVVWNDVGKVHKPDGTLVEEMARIRKILERAGYENWRSEE